MQDRLVQQAVAQILSFYYDPRFSTRSHGFRPNQSAHDAILDVVAYADQGYRWVVDMDLEKFFDTINHSKMVQVLSDDIEDGRVISLIHRFLRADVQTEAGVEKRDKGAPQGGPLSPILANILLERLDKELEARGLHFTRYADDMMIFCRTRRAAERVFESITRYIETKLLLKVNREKSRVCYIGAPDLKFLGYGFSHAGKRILPTIHRKTKAKFKEKVRDILKRNRGQSRDKFTSSLRTFLVGWCEYFKLARCRKWVEGTDEWIRRRIRMLYWKRWKRVRTKFAALKKLDIDAEQAWMWANSSKGYWRISNSPVLTLALGNDRLARLGWTWLGLVGTFTAWSN